MLLEPHCGFLSGGGGEGNRAWPSP